MKLFQKLHEKLGFTPSEGRVILLLVAAFLLGWGLKLLGIGRAPRPAFDYSALDSEFTARSTALRAESRDSLAPGRHHVTGKGARPAPGTKVNINTASKDELVALPGIGEAMAERIILYRDDHGPFTSVDQLAGVKGIGAKKLERLLPLCKTED